jgi:DNA-binding NarL/FixJ family response regulator
VSVDGYHTDMPTSILIVDPEPFFCEALLHALNGPDVRVVGWTSDENEAAELAASQPPDVILTELVLRQGSGLNLARRIGKTCATVVLTRRNEGDVLIDAVSAGAEGCLSHAIDLPRLRSVLSSMEPGRFIVDADRLGDALRRVAASGSGDPHGGADPLTLREREVLRLVADGHGNEEIATILYISTNTVRTHVARILKKIGAHSRAEATRIYLKSADKERASQVLHIRGPDLRRR